MFALTGAVDIAGVTAAVVIVHARTKALRERPDEVVKARFDLEMEKAVENMRARRRLAPS